MKLIWRAVAVAACFQWGAVSAAPTYQLTTLDNYGGVSGTRSYVYGMSANGTPVGQSIVGSRIDAVKWVGALAVPLKEFGLGQSEASAVNDSGQVVGRIRRQTSSNPEPALWNNDGTFSVLKPLATGAQAAALAIDNSGVIAGYAARVTGQFVAVTWRGATKPSELAGLPGAAASIAQAASDNAWIGGATTMADGVLHATLWKRGAPRDLGTGFGRGAQITALNRKGLAVGFGLRAQGDYWRPILWKDGQLTELETLNGTSAWPTGLNARGVAVGTGNVGSTTHAMLWQGGKAFDLNMRLDAAGVSSGWVLTEAVAISDQGVVLARATHKKTHVNQPVLLTPN